MKNKFKKIIIVLLSLVLSLSACAKPPIENNEPEIPISDLASGEGGSYTIVIPNNAKDSIVYAAEELQYFIKEAANIELEIDIDENFVFNPTEKIISLGETTLLKSSKYTVDYSSLNTDGFIIKTIGNNLFIQGQRDTGVLYGVYHFLETFAGIKFLTSDYTYIPKISNLYLYKTDIIEVPSFAARDYYSYQSMQEHAFSTRMRNNTFGSTYLPKYGHNARADYFGSTGHTILSLLPSEKYLEKNPDWYANAAGTEISYTHGITEDGEIDNTLENSAVKQLIENAKELIKSKPNAKYLMVSPSDNSVWCTSKKTRDSDLKYGGRSGTLMVFINAVAKALEEWGKETGIPEINVVTLAYWKTISPPVKNENGTITFHEKVVARNNVYIRFAHMSCFKHALTDTDCLNNTTNRNNLAGWSAICKNIKIWDYTVNYHNFFWYFPNLGSLKDNYTYYKSISVASVMSQGAPHAQNFYLSSLQMYVINKMLWNVENDVFKLAYEFNKYYFGEIASPYVDQYLNLMEYHFASLDSKHVAGFHTDLYDQSNFLHFDNYPIGFLELAIKYIDDAIAKVNDDSNLTDEEKETIVLKLKSVRVTPMYMVLKNFDAYYDNNLFYDYAIEFFDILKQLKINYYGENRSVTSLKTEWKIY